MRYRDAKPAANDGTLNQRVGFTTSERVWLCLTSLWHRRFVEDVIHVVGMPAGSRVRLRYRREHVASSLWREVENHSPNDRIIVLVALLAAAPDLPLQITPLRRCRLVSVGCQGSLMVLDVALDDFLIAEPNVETFWNALATIGARLPEGGRQSGPPSGEFLQELSVAPSNVLRDGSIRIWEKVAEAVFATDDATNGPSGSRYVPFLYLIAALDKRLRRSLLRQGALILEGGTSFSLDIHTITREHVGKILRSIGEVRLDVDQPATKFITSRRIRIDSKRDVRSIRLSTSATFRRSLGHLSVRSVYFGYKDDRIVIQQSPNSTVRGVKTRPSNDFFSGMPTKVDREEIVVARYDLPLSVGRILPWLACITVALAAAITVYKGSEGRMPTFASLLLPVVVFVLTFLGLRIGFKGEKA